MGPHRKDGREGSLSPSLYDDKEVDHGGLKNEQFHI